MRPEWARDRPLSSTLASLQDAVLLACHSRGCAWRLSQKCSGHPEGMREGSPGQAKRSPGNAREEPSRPERARDPSRLTDICWSGVPPGRGSFFATLPGAALRLPRATFSHPFGMPEMGTTGILRRPPSPAHTRLRTLPIALTRTLEVPALKEPRNKAFAYTLSLSYTPRYSAIPLNSDNSAKVCSARPSVEKL